MAEEININVGTGGSDLRDNKINIGDVAAGNIEKRPDESRNTHHDHEYKELQQRVKELEQLVFGDDRLGLVGIRQELKGQRFWTVANTGLTFVLVIYELFKITR